MNLTFDPKTVFWAGPAEAAIPSAGRDQSDQRGLAKLRTGRNQHKYDPDSQQQNVLLPRRAAINQRETAKKQSIMMKTYNCKSIVCSLTNMLLGSTCVFLACAISAQAQTGTFSVNESWSVTIAEDNGQTPTFSKTYSGTETGTLTVNDGNYTLIDKTGLSVAVTGALPANKPLILAGNAAGAKPKTWHTPGLDTNRVIYASNGGYEIDGSYPVVGFSGNYAIVQFSFFMVKVELPVTDFAIPVIDNGDPFTTTGSSLASLSGNGDETDDNTGFSASAYSESSLTSGPSPTTVAPKITSQPISQNAMLGASLSFSVGATGTLPLSYQWIHAGTNLLDGGEFSGSASSTLTITGVGIADAGNYSVVVSNTKGSVTSATAKLSVLAPITLSVSGRGTISGATNGQLEPLGQNLTLTAKPAAGYALTNWLVTVNGLTVLSTNRAVPFLMQPNLALTATFVDVQKPVLTITAPTANQRWSNSVFTVAGKVTDNGPGGAVWYQLNAGAWNTASGWSNWIASVTLNPGTNTVAAYAVDASGNASTTNSQKVVYVLSAPISLIVVGDGTLSGASNGQMLQLGKSVTLTAKAATGCILTNWLVAVDGTTILSTNKAAPFLMQSNLVLTATFVDVQKPVLTITAPTANQRWSNVVFTVAGKVADNGTGGAVWYRLNGGEWNTASGWSNWIAGVTLNPGTNALTVYAIDAAGNRSVTNIQKVVYVLSAPMTVQIVGVGTVSPNYNGQFLAIGSPYTMKATAGNGFAFYYWSGGVPMSANPTLTFTMSSNLTIIANFRDVMKPTNAIAFPVANLKWSNTVITVTGKAGDNVAVAAVGVQINNGGWTLAQSANGFATWNAANLPVTFGTNIVRFRDGF